MKTIVCPRCGGTGGAEHVHYHARSGDADSGYAGGFSECGICVGTGELSLSDCLVRGIAPDGLPEEWLVEMGLLDDGMQEAAE